MGKGIILESTILLGSQIYVHEVGMGLNIMCLDSLTFYPCQWPFCYRGLVCKMKQGFIITAPTLFSTHALL